MGGKEETLRELAGLMLEECPRLLEQMRRSLADGDVEELRRAAHTLKGSARLFAAHPTADAALEVEDIGREERLADDAVARVQTEVDRLLDSSITSATRSWHSPDSRSDLHGAAGS